MKKKWKILGAVGLAFAFGAAIASSSAARGIDKATELIETLNETVALLLDFFREIVEYPDCEELARRINAWMDAHGARLTELNRKVATLAGENVANEETKPYIDNWVRAQQIIRVAIEKCQKDAAVLEAIRRFSDAMTPTLVTTQE